MSITPDHRLGFSSEERNYKIIRATFGKDLNPTSRWNPFDFESETTVIELKTRRCPSTQYPDTMVPEHKIKKIPPGKECIFVFSFTDGMFYHKYDSKITYRVAKSGRYDRGRPEICDYCFIPVKDLILVENK